MSSERDDLGAALMDDLSFLLARATAISMSAGNRALTPFGLRVRSYSVLATCADGQRPTQRAIADYLRLDPSQVVALVDDLESRGFVQRTVGARDRRSKAISCTPAGREVFVGAREALKEAERTLHADLSPDERLALSALLPRLAFPTTSE